MPYLFINVIKYVWFFGPLKFVLSYRLILIYVAEDAFYFCTYLHATTMSFITFFLIHYYD